MKRDPRLRDLSDDHHQALVLARRATNAADADDATTCKDVWADAMRRFAAELEPHFAIEETLLLPAMELAGERDLAERTRLEHAQLRTLVRDVQQPMAARLRAFGIALRDHVRFEERLLFPKAQEKLTDHVLDAVAAASALSSSHCQPWRS